MVEMVDGRRKTKAPRRIRTRDMSEEPRSKSCDHCHRCSPDLFLSCHSLVLLSHKTDNATSDRKYSYGTDCVFRCTAKLG